MTLYLFIHSSESRESNKTEKNYFIFTSQVRLFATLPAATYTEIGYFIQYKECRCPAVYP